MAKLNWNPWMRLDDLADNLDRMFGEEVVQPESSCRWNPAADMVENAHYINIMVEVPGLRLEDIAVELEGRTLCVYGCRAFKRGSAEDVFHVLERSYGPFVRRFTLPDCIEKRSIAARIQDGLLTITIAKRTQKKRSIKVG